MYVYPSVRMKQLGSHRTDFHEIWCLSIFRKSVEKVQVSLKSDNNNGTLRKDLCTFMVISRWILIRMRNVSDYICRENQNAHFMFNNLFSENRAVYEIMYRNIVESGHRCWITKATDTHSEYVIPIAFPRQKWLRERASVLRLYTYIACLVIQHPSY
jgi:hypothetical protein